VQKSRDDILFIELVPGGKGEGIDTTKVAVRPVLNQFFDRAYSFRLC
jgi:hypothetical protein